MEFLLRGNGGLLRSENPHIKLNIFFSRFHQVWQPDFPSSSGRAQQQHMHEIIKSLHNGQYLERMLNIDNMREAVMSPIIIMVDLLRLPNIDSLSKLVVKFGVVGVLIVVVVLVELIVARFGGLGIVDSAKSIPSQSPNDCGCFALNTISPLCKYVQ